MFSKWANRGAVVAPVPATTTTTTTTSALVVSTATASSNKGGDSGNDDDSPAHTESPTRTSSSLASILTLPIARHSRANRNNNNSSSNSRNNSNAVASTASPPGTAAVVARLQEHLAWTRESYHASLKELESCHTHTAADKIELERLRAVVKDCYAHLQQQQQQQQQQKQQQREGGGKDGNGNNGNPTTSSSTSSTSSSTSNSVAVDALAESWQRELRMLSKGQAKAESRLVEQATTLRECNDRLNKLREENTQLRLQQKQQQQQQQQQKQQQQVVVSSSSSSSPSFSSAATQRELEGQIAQWEALYFETAEVGARKIQELEDQLASLHVGLTDFEKTLERQERIKARQQENDEALKQEEEMGAGYLSDERSDTHSRIFWMRRIKEMERTVRHRDMQIADLKEDLELAREREDDADFAFGVERLISDALMDVLCCGCRSLSSA